MKVTKSRFWKRCDAPYCIMLTDQKAIGLYAHWYLCREHLTDERVKELDQWDLAV